MLQQVQLEILKSSFFSFFFFSDQTNLVFVEELSTEIKSNALKHLFEGSQFAVSCLKGFSVHLSVRTNISPSISTRDMSWGLLWVVKRKPRCAGCF